MVIKKVRGPSTRVHSHMAFQAHAGSLRSGCTESENRDNDSWDMSNDAYRAWRAGWDGRLSAHAMHLEWSLRFNRGSGTWIDSLAHVGV